MKYLLLGLLLSSLSCTRHHTSDANTLIIGIESQPKTLDPRFATDAIGMNLMDLLFSSLVRWDKNMSLIGDAAMSWDFKENQYTFSLRPGLKFANGTYITAEDLIFSVNQYKKDTSPFKSSFAIIQKINAKYDKNGGHLKLTLKKFSASFLADLTVLKILPRKIIEKTQLDFSESLIGSGSFLLSSKNENEILLERSPYAVRKPKIKKVLFKVVRDDTSRFQRMYKGTLDIVQNDMPLTKISIFKNSPRFKVYESIGLSMTYLLLNLKDPLLKNKKLRQAINLAINRTEIIKHKMENYATPATSIMTPATPYYDKNLPTPVYDIERAQKVFPKGFANKQLIIKSSSQAAAVDKAHLLAYQISKLGLNISVKSYEWGTYYGDVKSGNFQLATMRWVGIADPDIYRLAFHSSQLPPNGRNRGHYQNSELDSLLEAGLLIKNTKQRIEHYKKVQKIIFNDLPIIPLWYDNLISIVNKRVTNYYLTPNGNFDFVYEVEKVHE